MQSAFEQPIPSFGSASSSRSSLNEGMESESQKLSRVVGFPDTIAPAQSSPEARCEIARRQSNLGQQLLLQNLERQKPKLPIINTRAPQRGRPRPSRLISSGGQQHNHQADFHTSFTEPTTESNPAITSGTLPSVGGHLTRRGWSIESEAVTIPPMGRAFTAPELLPELSPAVAQRLISEKTHSHTHSPRDFGASVATPSTSPPSHPMCGGRGARPASASAQVAVLREALRREQDEVARLRHEMSKLKAERGHFRSSSAGNDKEGPVTPGASSETPGRNNKKTNQYYLVESPFSGPRFRK